MIYDNAVRAARTSRDNEVLVNRKINRHSCRRRCDVHWSTKIHLDAGLWAARHLQVVRRGPIAEGEASLERDGRTGHDESELLVIAGCDGSRTEEGLEAVLQIEQVEHACIRRERVASGAIAPYEVDRRDRDLRALDHVGSRGICQPGGHPTHLWSARSVACTKPRG